MSLIKSVLNNGSQNFVLHLHMEQDGGDGELNDYVLVDPDDFGLPKRPTLRLLRAWHSLVWFDVILKFNGIVPRTVWTFARDVGPCVDFSVIGGLCDRGVSPPSEDDGKVLISTNGFAELGSRGTLILAFSR